MFLHITQQKDFFNCQRQSAVRAYDIPMMCQKYCLHRVCKMCYGYTTQYHWSTQMHRHVHMHTCNIHMCACTSFTTCNTSSFIQCSSVPNLLIVKIIQQGILKSSTKPVLKNLGSYNGIFTMQLGNMQGTSVCRKQIFLHSARTCRTGMSKWMIKCQTCNILLEVVEKKHCLGIVSNNTQALLHIN